MKIIRAICTCSIPFEGWCIVGEEYTFKVYPLCEGSEEIVYECNYFDYRLECTDQVFFTEECINDHFEIIWSGNVK